MPALASLLLFGVLGAAAIYIYLRPSPIDPSQTAGRWERLEIPKAEYNPPDPRIVLRMPSKAFENAIASYQQSDFVSAAEQLGMLSELEPGNVAEIQFYLGVSLLLIGRSEEAILSLKKAAETSAGWQREASDYYLAYAFLKRDQPQQAIVELDKVIEMNGAYRAAATSLKRQVLDATK